MAGIEVTGLILSVAGSFELLIDSLGRLRRNLQDYGISKCLLLYIAFPQATAIIERVRKHILVDPNDVPLSYHEIDKNSEQEAWTLKKSFSASFNMIAVAGAIVAQIAITALTLPYLESTHWAAEAAFVVSLATGLLSVWYACMVQIKLGSLQGPKEVKNWLTVYRHVHTGSGQELIPSFSSAILLVGPTQLLNWSLVSLLTGIGIYFGLVLSKHLGNLSGYNANLAVLLFYVFFTGASLGSFLLPDTLNSLEGTTSAEDAFQEQLRRFREQMAKTTRDHADEEDGRVAAGDKSEILHQPVKATDGANTPSESARGVAGHAEDEGVPRNSDAGNPPVRQLEDALRTSIAAQSASVKAQEALLEALMRGTLPNQI